MEIVDLNQFIQKQKIGSGAFSDVYKVEEKATGDIFAAKVSKYSFDEQSKDQLLALKREINIMAGTNHPAVIGFKGISYKDFKGEPKLVIITEYMPNGTLSEIIQLERQSMSQWDETLKLVNIYGIAVAMAYLHSHKIIHRDLKPQNILLNEYKFPKIADFGLSKINHQSNGSLTTQSMADCSKGTPIYMAPEIYNSNDYSNESDVYSYAFIVYEILTNQAPYEGIDNFFAMMKKIIIGERPTFNIPIPECFQQLIEKCWDDNPHNRPSFDQIVNDLKNNSDYLEIGADQDEFLQYVDYIDECKTSFDSNKRIIQFDDFIKLKSISSSFQQSTIDRESISRLIKEKSINSSNQSLKESRNNKVHESTNSLDKIIETYEQKNADDSTRIDNILESPQKSKELQINQSSNNIQSYDSFQKSQTNNSNEKTKTKRMGSFTQIKSMPDLNTDNEEIGISISETEDDHMKQFTIGKSYIEGTNNFPVNIETGIKYLEKSIKGKNIDAAIYYCKMLIKGDIIIQNLSKAEKILRKHLKDKDATVHLLYGKIKKKKNEDAKAFTYFEKSASAGSAEGMYNYAKMLFKGIGCEPNQNKALQYIELSKTNGYDKTDSFFEKLDGNFLYDYGMKLFTGNSVRQNKEEAIKLFKISIKKNNTDSMLKYADILYHGDGVPINKKEAFKYYQMAADNGNIKASTVTGNLLSTGDGTTVDKKKASEYYKYAANKDDPVAMTKYAILLENGDGIEVDKKEALILYGKAIDQGYNRAIRHLTSLLKKPNELNLNKKDLAQYYKKAADNDDDDSMFQYAEILFNEDSTESSKKEAMKYYKMAAKKDNIDAMHKYGSQLIAGNYIKKNEKEGAKYIKKAANRGHVEATFDYGYLLSNGIGVPKNTNEALKYYKNAANNGFVKGMFYYAYTLQNKIKGPVDKREVIKYYKLAIDKGYNDAIKSYAGCLLNGYGVPKDENEAAKYYKIAADNGDKDSLSMYNKIKSELVNKSSNNGGKSLNFLPQNKSNNSNSNVPKQQEPTNPPKFHNSNERFQGEVFTSSPDIIGDLEPLDTNDTNNSPDGSRTIHFTDTTSSDTNDTNNSPDGSRTIHFTDTTSSDTELYSDESDMTYSSDSIQQNTLNTTTNSNNSKPKTVLYNTNTNNTYEKAVVIDNGSVWCKAGFAGDEYPRSVFPNKIGHSPFLAFNEAIKQNSIYVGDAVHAPKICYYTPIKRGEVSDWLMVEQIYKHEFKNELRVDPSECAVLISEKANNNNKNRQIMAQIFFETFNVPAFMVDSTTNLSLISMGCLSGLSIDMGGSFIQIDCIYDSQKRNNRSTTINIGGEDIISKIKGFYSDNTGNKILHDEAVEVLQKFCYVSYDFNTENRKANLTNIKNKFKLSSGKTITMGKEIFTFPEILFEHNSFIGSIKSLIDFNRDEYQKGFYSNVCLSGGNSLIRGLPERLEKELKYVTPSNMKLKVIAPPERKFSAWIGGSIFCNTQAYPNMAIKRNEYNEEGPQIINRKYA